MVASIQIFFFLMIYLNLLHGVLIKIVQEKNNNYNFMSQKTFSLKNQKGLF